MKILEGFKIRYSLIRDPIYNFVELPDKLKPIIDHALFQRLRRISQTPGQDMVYPSAHHTRFEHSLGTMYLSMFAIVSLINNSEDIIKELIQEDEILNKIESLREAKIQLIFACATIGLLHDIGHAPFSHTLEEAIDTYILLKKYKGEESRYERYDHELKGLKFISQIKKDYEEVEGETFFFNFVIKLFKIKENQKEVKRLEKKLIKLNSSEEKKLSKLKKNLTKVSNLTFILISLIDDDLLDIDKGDYLLRDSHHCGVDYGKYDFFRLWSNLVLFKDEDNYKILVKEKSALEVWNLRIARFNMYISVYKHNIRQITDAMLSNLIIEALDKGINIVPTNNNDFINWTDDIMLSIFFQKNKFNKKLNPFLNRKLLKKTRNIKTVKRKNIFQLNQDLESVLKEFNINKNEYFIYEITEPLAPVLEEVIQCKKVILSQDNEIYTIAEYFDFFMGENFALKKKYRYSIFLNADKFPFDKKNKSPRRIKIEKEKILDKIKRFLDDVENGMLYDLNEEEIDKS